MEGKEYEGVNQQGWKMEREELSEQLQRVVGRENIERMKAVDLVEMWEEECLMMMEEMFENPTWRGIADKVETNREHDAVV